MKWYAVRVGRVPGIYTTWDECQKQTNGFSGAIFKSFPTRSEAEAFLGTSSVVAPSVVAPSVVAPSVVAPSVVAPSINPGIIYADGSCQNGKAGYAFLYNSWVVFGPITPATNNRGELAACVRALQMVSVRPITIKTDSKYVIETVTNWLPGWIRKYGSYPENWRTSSGGLPLNLDLLVILYNLSSGVNYQHVYGHTGDPGNELVDSYAKRGCFETYEQVVNLGQK
jgi:ribonuclease HI